MADEKDGGGRRGRRLRWGVYRIHFWSRSYPYHLWFICFFFQGNEVAFFRSLKIWSEAAWTFAKVQIFGTYALCFFSVFFSEIASHVDAHRGKVFFQKIRIRVKITAHIEWMAFSRSDMLCRKTQFQWINVQEPLNIRSFLSSTNNGSRAKQWVTSASQQSSGNHSSKTSNKVLWQLLVTTEIIDTTARISVVKGVSTTVYGY